MAAPLVVAPIFPLPDVTFFPHTLMPLHVFEARYRVMVIDALERDRRLAVVRLQPGYEATYAGKPAVHTVGGLGEIVSCERLATGRYNILLRGECRVRIEQELPSDTLYRVVRARRLVDGEAAGDAAPALARIRAACRTLLGALARPADLLDTALADGQAPASSPIASPPPSCPTPICARACSKPSTSLPASPASPTPSNPSSAN